MANSIGDWVELKNGYIQETRDRESIEPKDLCSYGIKPLDDALLHIGKNELVVIGAETGQGKSELSLSIARHNAKNGKSVAVYYLEGGHLEAIRRMKWRDMADKYYSDFNHKANPVSFTRWMYNYQDAQVMTEIEGEVFNDYNKLYKDKLYFYPTTKDFTVDKFMMSLMSFHELLTPNLGLDLIIVDHLQYFSLAQSDSEITEITKILRAVKQITEYYNTPVILVSHLRKRGKNSGLPSHEDFYGSGNIAKISTTSIMISPATDRDSYAKNIFPTYLRVVKSRVGMRPNYAFLINFDLNRRCYEDEYQIYKVNSFGELSPDALTNEELPKWSKKNI